MISRTALLAILALPAAVIGYAVTAGILSGLSLPDGLKAIALTFAPLLVAGLCMVPFVLPLFSQMASRDLAAYRAAKADESAAPGNTDPD